MSLSRFLSSFWKSAAAVLIFSASLAGHSLAVQCPAG
jgi:hypothetical protein